MDFKILHGKSSNISLDITPFHEGWAYVTHDGHFYVDLNIGTADNPNNQRIKLNSASAEMLDGMSLEELKEWITTQDIAVLQESQAYTDEVMANFEKNFNGLSLVNLGDFATATPNINPNDYAGFAYRIGVDYDYGMGFDIVKSGMLFFENLNEYGYGGGVYFPFTTSDLYNAGVMIDPYGNGANANEKVVIQMSPNADWTSYEITFNPFLGASFDSSYGNGRVFVKIFGIKA